jgi:lipopolysaccharide export system protein LptA
LQAQERKRIEIKYSGFYTFDEEKFPGANILTRDDSQQVHIIHEGVVMFADKAIHYGDQDFIEAYGNVKMIQGDTINMTSKYIEYSGKSKLAFASGEVVLREPSSTLTTDTLYFDREKQEAFYNTGGQVVRDSSGTITSKIGRYYAEKEKYQFVDSVKLVNPDYVIDTDRLDFFSASGHAYMYGPTTITGEESVIYCERGFYNTDDDTGYFIKNSRIDYDNRVVVGDSMYFDRSRSFASATNNITITDTINKSIITGHYAEVFRDKDSVFITKRALAITVQEKDSVYIHADTLMVTGKPEQRITRGFYNVKMFKSDMSGKSDSIHVDHKAGLTQLLNIDRLGTRDAFSVSRKPILWNLAKQMTGDTIHILSNPETEKIDTLKVFDHAFLISKDTLDAGYNQVSGKKLIGLFDDENQLNVVDIIKNAESIYYIRDDKNVLIGIDKAKSASIKLLIEDSNIDQIFRYKEAECVTFPPSQYPEKDKLLRGFDWREEERPESIEDLFKDDPPFTLPIIKGLDAYIPQEDFFDTSMRKRVDNAGKTKSNTTRKDNKAARHIPKPASGNKPSLIKPMTATLKKSN